ncbi:prephenate dehydrogenase [Desulfonauticus submarinus]|uniref:Prephenate dehydrogenase n=1 Tax=Desulfonauticus submarinus TaxID=206665 RepID=A0A1H0BIF4_9BACT|nr:prephenate dehydrogenase/arogenate dehydrogenase family protein [Desulfonauticus submarinus]SDN45428.1 prephenate dehydrogenase [Desulfonauticus submarinus]
MLKSIKQITIFGSRGQMGRLFFKKAKNSGYLVYGFDLPLNLQDIEDALSRSDLILLCVPIKSLTNVLKEISFYLHSSQILMDICSVKVLPLQMMEESFSGPVVGSHPLFGPDLKDDFRKIALCPGKISESEMELVYTFWQDLGFDPFIVSAVEHDKAMAYIQGLNFITNLTYFAYKAGQKEIEQFITPSFQRRMDSAYKMLVKDFRLFADLFEKNPYSGESVRQFKSYLNLAAAGDLEVLAEKAWWWWRNIKIKGGP